MNLHKKWLPVLKDIPKANHEKFVMELEKKYSEAMLTHNGIQRFVSDIYPKLKAKYQDSYISPFTNEIILPTRDK